MDTIAEQASYYGNIEAILVANWKEQVRSGRKLLEVVDNCKLVEVDTSKLNLMLQNMTEFDIAQLKIFRMKLKDKRSREKISCPKLHQEIENLKKMKSSLLSEKNVLQKEINHYTSCVSLYNLQTA